MHLLSIFTAFFIRAFCTANSSVICKKDYPNFKALKTDTIVVVVVCDNHFVVMLAALLKSIDKSHITENLITVYLIDDGISEKNKGKINDTVADSAIELIWMDIADAIPSYVKLPLDASTFPISVYARLCIPYFLPKDVKKAIYLDADTLVLRDIRDLWDIDISGFGVAAVADRSKVVSSSWAGIPNYVELGIDPNAKYFNTGVLVIDVEKWRAENTPLAVFKCVEDNIEHASFPDQYGLNLHFINKWYELNAAWNSYAQCDLKKPYIIHFTGLKPIYTGYAYNRDYQAVFFEHLHLTPFRDFKPRYTYFRYLKKFLHLTRKKWLYFLKSVSIRK